MKRAGVVYTWAGKPAGNRLSKHTRKVLAALADVVLPDDPSAPRLPVERVIDAVDRYIGFMPSPTREILPLGIEAFNAGPIALPRFRRPLTALSIEKRREYVNLWAHSENVLLHSIFKGIKGLVFMGYCVQPEVEVALGYKPAEHVRHILKVRGQWEDLLNGLPSTMIPNVENAGPSWTFPEARP